MITQKVSLSERSKKLPKNILENRLQSNSDWIEEHASGTLHDNKEMGFVWSMQCLSERIAYTFGYEFCAIKENLVSFNDAITECDEYAYTISGRLFKRYVARKLFDEDEFEIKYLNIKDESLKTIWEGIGIVVKKTSANFIPDNVLVCAKLVKYDAVKKEWGSFKNFA